MHSKLASIALLPGLLAAAAACATQPPSPAAPPSPPIAGGYAPANVDAPGYAEAEALAIETIYKREPQRGLVESKSVEVQVVAGLNFRFDIKMTGPNRYTVVVYRDLQGQLQVTEFSKKTG